jgi:hypothetical protein
MMPQGDAVVTSDMLKAALFVVLLLGSLTPWVSAPVALMAGLVFALTLGTPFPSRVKQWQTLSLQVAVVGLGAGMNLAVVGRVGLSGVGLMRVPRDLDHRFRGDPIGHSTGSRSPVPREADHLFHGKPITCSTGSRSPVPREADHPFHGKPITRSTGSRSPEGASLSG